MRKLLLCLLLLVAACMPTTDEVKSQIATGVALTLAAVDDKGAATTRAAPPVTVVVAPTRTPLPTLTRAPTNTPTATATPTVTPTPQLGFSRSRPLPPHEPLTFDSWRVQLLQVVRGAAAAEMVGDRTATDDGHEFVWLEIEVANVADADEARSLDQSHFRLTGALARRYAAERQTPGLTPVAFELLSGAQTQGWLLFEVAAGEQNLMLTAEDADTYVALTDGARVLPPQTLPAQNPAGVDRHAPAAPGVEVISSGYAITLQEVISGTAAAERVTAVNRFNPAPPEGYHYLLARFTVSSWERSERARLLSPFQFRLSGSRGELYRTPIVVDPQPALHAELYAGGTVDGWVTLLAADGETGLVVAARPFGGETRYLALAAPAAGGGAADQGITLNDFGVSSDHPAPFGATAADDQYAVTLLDVIGPAEAQDLIAQASSLNEPAPDGFDYYLLQLQISRYGGDQATDSINRNDFGLLDQSGVIHAAPSLILPLPPIDADLYSGGTTTGWLVLQGPAGATDLALLFRPSNRFLSFGP